MLDKLFFRKASTDLAKFLEDHESNFEELVKKYPPKLGLKYLSGFWKIPWLIMPKWFEDKQVDRVKLKIANDPTGDIACAYAMGMLDAKDGKLTEKYLGSDIEILEVTREWFTKFGFEIPDGY